MKKKLLFGGFLFVSFLSSSLLAQKGDGNLKKVTENVFYAPREVDSNSESRTITCVDTIRYVQNKEFYVGTAPGTGNYYTVDVWEADDEAVSQAYLLSGSTMTITGVEFVSLNNPDDGTPTATIQVSIYNVDGSNNPTTLLGSQNITISHTSLAFSRVNFATPISVSSNYAIVLKPISVDAVVEVYYNDLISGQIHDEGLSRITSTYPLYGSGGNWVDLETLDKYNLVADGEPVLNPIVSYSITSAFTASSISVCLGTPVTFTNQSTPASILSNRMYSFWNFADYFNLAGADSTSYWSFGDGNISVQTNPSHLYSAVGNYNVELDIIGGFSSTCLESSTTAITVVPSDDATFSYSATTACVGSANLTIASAATPGGNYSSTTGLVFVDAFTGEIDVTASTVGSYVVTYTTPGTCSSTSTQTITITAADDATFNYASSTICLGGTNESPATVATPGGTFSSTTGLVFVDNFTGEIDVTASTAGTYVVTYTTVGSCSATATQTITITSSPDASFTYAATEYCTSASNPSPVVTGSTGSFSSTTGLIINATTGVVNLATSTPGTYTVTNSIPASGSCAAASETFDITITQAGNAAFTFASEYCLDGTNPSPVVTGTAGTFSSTTGLTIDATTGVIDLATSTAGSYTITNTVAGTGVCPAATATATVALTAAPNAAFTYAATEYCASGTTVSPVVTGTAGTFSSTTGLVINATTGVIDVATSTPGSYTVTNSVAASGSCGAASETFAITITAAGNAAFTYSPSVYCLDGTNPSPVVTGTVGTFSSTTGLAINASTGVVDLATSTVGMYTVTNTVAASGVCPVATATATVTIDAETTATATLSGTTLTATETGVTYQWINCSGNTPISGATSQTYTATTPGSYAVVTTNGGCTATSACVTVSDLGVKDNSIDMVTVYPNPTENMITISGLNVKNAEVSILDINGRVLTVENTNAATLELSVRDFEAGVYFISVKSDSINGTKRFVKK